MSTSSDSDMFRTWSFGLCSAAKVEPAGELQRQRFMRPFADSAMSAHHAGQSERGGSSDRQETSGEVAAPLEDALNSILAAAQSLDSAARARLTGQLTAVLASLGPTGSPGGARLLAKAPDNRALAAGDAFVDQIGGSPGKLPRRRVTTGRAGETQTAMQSSQQLVSPQPPAAPASTHLPARSTLLQTQMLFLVFRFLDAHQLSGVSPVCSAWRTTAADERLWMWLSLGSGLPKPTVMPGSWRKDFIQKHLLARNWIHGRCSVTTCSGHREAITCLCVSGNVVASGSDDMELRVWDLHEDPHEGGPGARCALRHVHSGHTGKVLCCCFVRNLLLSGSEDKTVRVWDSVSGKHLATLSEHTHSVLCLTTDGKRTVYSGGADSTVCMWCVDNMELVAVMTKHRAAVLCLAYMASIQSVVTGGRDNDIGIWSAVRCDSDHPGGSSSRGVAAVSGKVADHMGAVDSRRRAKGKAQSRGCGGVRLLQGHESSIVCIQTDDHLIASGSDDATVRLWNAHCGICIRVLEPHGGPVSCISVQGNALLSGSFDGKVRLFDMLSGRCLRSMTGHENAVLSIATTQRMCITGANDRDVRIWDYHDQSPPPISDSVAKYKENWGMPAARRSSMARCHNPCRTRSPDCSCRVQGRCSPLASQHAVVGSLGTSSSAASFGNLTGDASMNMSLGWSVMSAGALDGGGGEMLRSGTVVLADAGASHRGMRSPSAEFSLDANETQLAEATASSDEEPEEFVQAASSRRGVSLRTPGTTKAQALLPPSDTIPEYPGYALQGHCSGVQEVVVIKGRFVISASDDYDIRIWDFGSKKQEHFPEHVHVGRKSNC